MMDAVTNDVGVAIEVRRPTKPPLSRRLILWLATRGIGWNRDPWLVVINRWGGVFPLFRASCTDEAQGKKARLESEIATLGIEEWADRYTVPGTFFSPAWSEREIPAQ